MPRISFFYGIGIWMYWNEGSHQRPHFHARYAGHQASVAFDGEIIVGWLPARALRLVRDWAALHQPELEANWSRALQGEALQRVDPLP
jgi:Domain of unknown function (DUF4160)